MPRGTSCPFLSFLPSEFDPGLETDTGVVRTYRLAAHSILSIGLDQLEQQLGKSKRIDKVTAAEIQEYQQEVAALGALFYIRNICPPSQDN
jgi:hypothetical protein